jgi:hypothetical protein
MLGLLLVSMVGIQDATAHSGNHHTNRHAHYQVNSASHHHASRQHRVWVSGRWAIRAGKRVWIRGFWDYRPARHHHHNHHRNCSNRR